MEPEFEADSPDETDAQAPEDVDVETGTGAVARAVKDVGVDVVSAYPITPQTEIVEDVAEYVENDHLDAEFSRVESEHSALATAMGASQAGARTFTATASQGLLYMSEMVWWTAGARLPTVMAIANRALGPAWNIWGSHTDALSHRDAGWVQLFAADVQEAYDLTVTAYRIAEDENVMLPAMVNLDGFTLAHTMQRLTQTDPDTIEKFLGDPEIPHAVDTGNPRGYGALAGGNEFWRFRKKMMDAMDRVPNRLDVAFEEYGELTGREYSQVHEYATDDANLVIIGLGTLAREAEVAVDLLREDHDVNAGVVRPILYTPFPNDEVATAVGDADKVVILDRATSFGRGGIVTRDVRSALDQEVASVITGIGGQPVDYEDIVDIALRARTGETQWFGQEGENA